MSTATEQYRYDRTITHDEIRILTLKPSPVFEYDIECDLERVGRQTCGSYTALSYWWGPDEQSQVDIKIRTRTRDSTSSVGYSTLAIGSELACSLRHIRQPSTESRLWIDALCINQRNTAEKNGQVQKWIRRTKSLLR